jgi:membrane associated rhomboid family serine protease
VLIQARIFVGIYAAELFSRHGTRPASPFAHLGGLVGGALMLYLWRR